MTTRDTVEGKIGAVSAPAISHHLPGRSPSPLGRLSRLGRMRLQSVQSGAGEGSAEQAHQQRIYHSSPNLPVYPRTFPSLLYQPLALYYYLVKFLC